MIKYLKRKFQEWKKNRAYARKLKELKKRDPFNYKNF